MSEPAFNDRGKFPVSYGYSVRRQQEFVPGTWDMPTHIFFLYIRINKDGTLEIAHYFDDLKGRPVEQAEKDLFANARPLTDSHPRREPEPQGYNFENMSFDGFVSYFTIALDERLMDFHPVKDHQDMDPMIFIAEKTTFDASGQPTTNYFNPNFSIMNLERVVIETGKAGDRRPALRCVNFMKRDEAGNYMKDGDEMKFGFDLYVDMPFNRETGGSKMLTVIFDPGGTSTGPKRP